MVGLLKVRKVKSVHVFIVLTWYVRVFYLAGLRSLDIDVEG